MDQASGSEISAVVQTAAFARRVVCRALTVVGGVAAGTAIAWWLSTASAAAETEPLAPEVQVSDVVAAEIVAPVSDTVEDQVTELRDRVKDAAEEFEKRAADGVEQLPNCEQAVPDCDLGIDRAVPLPPADTDDGGRADTAPTTGPVAPAAPPAAAGPVAGPGAAPDASTDRSAQDRALADGMSRRGSPAPVAPLPSWPAPFVPTPPSTPATGHSGQTGNAVDSSLFAALPWQNSISDLVAGGALPATEVATCGRPDAQPGVKPD